MDARKYKANRGETRQGKSDIKHLLQKKKKEIQFITSRKKNWKFLLQSQVNFKYCYLLFELD